MRRGKGGKGVFEGRGVVLVVAVLIVGLSFALGFFVGKATDTQETAADKALAPPQATVKGDLPPSTPQNAPSFDNAPVAQVNVSNVPRPEKNESLKEANESLKEARQNRGEPWSIQAGAFGNRKEAEALKKRLEAGGYKVYIVRHDEAGGKTIYKVRTGRFKSKTDADNLAARLRASEHLEVFVGRQ